MTNLQGRVDPSPVPIPKQAIVSTCLEYKSFENMLGKGETAHHGQFFLFPQSFVTFWITFHHFHYIKNCSLQTLSKLKLYKRVLLWRLSKEVDPIKLNFKMANKGFDSTQIYTEPQRKRRTKKYNSQFSLHFYNEIVYV